MPPPVPRSISDKEFPVIGGQFKLEVDGLPPLFWTQIEGLGMKIEVEQIKEGGWHWTAPHLLIKQVSYTPVKLTRWISSRSPSVVDWIVRFLPPYPQPEWSRNSVTITALTVERKPLIAWELKHAFPTSWTGPSLDAAGTGAVKESIEIQYTGISTSKLG